MRAVYKTEIGKVRNKNQDFLICDPKNEIYIVADGLGGYKHGEKASEFCAHSLHGFLKKATFEGFGIAMDDAVVNINEKLVEHSYSKYSGALMGSTLLGVRLYFEEKLKIGIVSVGDSSLYGIKDDKIIQINQRHSERKGSNILNSAIGRGLLEAIDSRIIEEDFDYLLLCTDGLTAEIDDGEILSIVSNNDFISSADILVNKALSGQAKDNITAIVLDLRRDR